jgi:iron-sulfur cluster assembly protein
MLAVSPAASAAISSALEGTDIPDGAGLRLAAGPPTERGVAIEIGFAAAPEPDDQVVETDAPADVFVEPHAAALLEDQVLDAEIQPDGAISFSLHAQQSGGGPDAAMPGMG